MVRFLVPPYPLPPDLASHPVISHHHTDDHGLPSTRKPPHPPTKRHACALDLAPSRLAAPRPRRALRPTRPGPGLPIRRSLLQLLGLWDELLVRRDLGRRSVDGTWICGRACGDGGEEGDDGKCEGVCGKLRDDGGVFAKSILERGAEGSDR